MKPWALEKNDRIELIHKIRMDWPQQLEVVDRIQELIQFSRKTSEPEVLALFAKYGMGKSTTLDLVEAKYKRIIMPEKTLFSVLRVTIPPVATPDNLLSGILLAIKDPAPSYGTLPNKVERIFNYIEDCQIKIIMFDEGNHLIDLTNYTILLNSTNMIQFILKEKNLPCVIAGLPYTDEIRTANPQFGSLFLTPVTYEVFEYDYKFAGFMRGYEKLLPLQNTSLFGKAKSDNTEFIEEKSDNTGSGKEKSDIIKRAYIATAGRTRYMVDLLKEAGKLAVRRSKDGLDKDLLAEAFNTKLAGKRRGQANPFVGPDIPEFKPIEDVYMPLRVIDKGRRKGIFK